ncbi:response regulator receiver modulated diguanylate cyclase [Candidatus Omnitrophus magneticus]|uniref:diguanylate cyclase n=1 Tax=Candidatus Omnitrophus magneticus TaxID=1609969 RepID=A0A0F0CWV5_9BACT|nr:response regulator receiver modulated diguanylate cyclase [Candidatus Omnitrophus magneticus]
MEKSVKILVISADDNIQSSFQGLDRDLGYKFFFEKSQSLDISRVIKLAPTVILGDIYFNNKLNPEFCETLKTDFATRFTPLILLIKRCHLSDAILKIKGIDDYITKPLDPIELVVRVDLAIRRIKHSISINPLTGLPGGTFIEEVLNKEIKSGKPFVAGHIDIDNFKTFNDRYGYLKGDRAIMQTAYMLTRSVRNWGNKEDFVGHIGGDDFVFTSTIDKFKDICQNFICMFDTIIPFHYSHDDRIRGYIRAKDRHNKIRKIPLMTVTVALVIKNSQDEISNIIELNEKTAEVKKYLKKIPGSKYMADRRILKKDEALTLQIFKNDDTIMDAYKPLGQILLEKNIISLQELDTALKVHWKQGMFLGEVLRELGYLTKEELTKALFIQETSLTH